MPHPCQIAPTNEGLGRNARVVLPARARARRVRAGVPKRRVAAGSGHSSQYWGGLGTRTFVAIRARLVPLSGTRYSDERTARRDPAWVPSGPAWTRTRDQPSTQGSGWWYREMAGSGSTPSFSPLSPLCHAEPVGDVWALIGHSDTSPSGQCAMETRLSGGACRGALRRSLAGVLPCPDRCAWSAELALRGKRR